MRNTSHYNITSNKCSLTAGLLSLLLFDLGLLYLLEFKKWLLYRIGIWGLIFYVGYSGVISNQSEFIIFILVSVCLKLLITFHTIRLCKQPKSKTLEKFNRKSNHVLVFLCISVINLTFISPTSLLWSKSEYVNQIVKDLHPQLKQLRD